MSRGAWAAWGKLPAFADFVRIGAPSAHTQAWANWFDAVPIESLGEFAPRSRDTKAEAGREPGIDWHTLEPAEWREKRRAHPLPWSFVLPPRILPFAANDWVVGAMTESCDKVGRRHPFVIYQVVSDSWVKRHLREARSPAFWWARLLAQHTPPVALVSESQLQAHVALDVRLDQLGRLYRRHWWQAFGAERVADSRACREIVGELHDSDPARHLQGVTAPPWSDWPEVVVRQTTIARFWQQDDHGRYVGMKELNLSATGPGERSFR